MIGFVTAEALNNIKPKNYLLLNVEHTCKGICHDRCTNLGLFLDATFLANFICDWTDFGKVSNLSATMAASVVGLRAISSIVTCIMASTAQNYNNEKKNVNQFFVSVVDTCIFSIQYSIYIVPFPHTWSKALFWISLSRCDTHHSIFNVILLKAIRVLCYSVLPVSALLTVLRRLRLGLEPGASTPLNQDVDALDHNTPRPYVFNVWLWPMPTYQFVASCWRTWRSDKFQLVRLGQKSVTENETLGWVVQCQASVLLLQVSKSNHTATDTHVQIHVCALFWIWYSIHGVPHIQNTNVP